VFSDGEVKDLDSTWKLFLWGAGMLIVGIVIGRFIDRLEKRHRVNRRIDFLEKYVDDLESKARRNDGAD
jgi:uncharacterized membrane-anchored protein YhcB (DUF1043 family)